MNETAGEQGRPSAVPGWSRLVLAVALVGGAVLLALSMRCQPGESKFYWLALAMAAVWLIGAFASRLVDFRAFDCRGRNLRVSAIGGAAGLLLGGLFVVFGLIARNIAFADEQISRVLVLAGGASRWPLLATALAGAFAEELFYRGALYRALSRQRPVLLSTAIYVLVVALASGNLMLTLAAMIIGTVCAAQRRMTGGVAAPLLTHSIWSVVVLLALPPMFSR